MFAHYLKTAWRNLRRDRQFTFLNLVGLSTGLACTILIYLWVNDELQVDKFHANDPQLYQVMEKHEVNNNLLVKGGTSGLLAETLAGQMPEVEYATPVIHYSWFPRFILSGDGTNKIKGVGQFAGKDFFNVFSYGLIRGNASQVLNDKQSVVISETLARKLFNTDDVVGKAITWQLAHIQKPVIISGVFKQVPASSSQQFDFVLSFEYFKSIKEWVTRWGDRGPSNYVLLNEGTDIKALNQIVADVITVNTGDTTRRVFAARFSDLYLHNNYGKNAAGGGRIQFVKLFSLLAIFVLVIACINFMNLSTAKASRRLKEIGIKKVVGADRKQLIFQFLSESLMLTLCATVFAVGLALLLLPAFNRITGKQIDLHFDTTIVMYFIAIVLCTGLLAGSYPSLYLSRFNPLTVLKGKLNTSIAELLSRKGLVVFQFTLSTILIVSVIVINQQIQFIQNTDAGYNKNSILRFSAEGNIRGKEEGFITQLKNIAGVVNASTTYHKMVGRGYSHAGMQWQGQDPDIDVFFEAFEVNYDFIETMGMQMKEGRSFSRSFGGDSTNIVLNETAVKVMGLKNPVGSTIQKSGKNMQVIGVVKDFHFESLHEPIKPAYLFLEPGNIIVVSVRSNNQRQTISAIQRLYEKYNSGFPFTFNFLDEAYQKQYDSETRVSALSKYFAGLAIVISCLGLFGLAAFTAQKRRKEISVRKVVGASVVDITAMLSKDFLQLIFISLVIALPVSWWVMSNWLQNFAYRINITPYVFVIAGISVVLVTLFTISFQSIKAAMSNPVNSLRSE